MMFRCMSDSRSDCPFEHRVELDCREHRGVGLPERARDLQAPAGQRADHVGGDHAAGREAFPHQLDELECREVERHAVE